MIAEEIAKILILVATIVLLVSVGSIFLLYPSKVRQWSQRDLAKTNWFPWPKWLSRIQEKSIQSPFYDRNTRIAGVAAMSQAAILLLVLVRKLTGWW